MPKLNWRQHPYSDRTLLASAGEVLTLQIVTRTDGLFVGTCMDDSVEDGEGDSITVKTVRTSEGTPEAKEELKSQLETIAATYLKDKIRAYEDALKGLEG